MGKQGNRDVLAQNVSISVSKLGKPLAKTKSNYNIMSSNLQQRKKINELARKLDFYDNRPRHSRSLKQQRKKKRAQSIAVQLLVRLQFILFINKIYFY